MSEIIYCHQCAKDNAATRKFCLACGTPLQLRGNADDKSRACSNCGQANPSFAKFCSQCSRPLVRTPDKGPGPDIPLLLNNRQVEGSETCPGCGRPAELLSQLVAHEAATRTAFVGLEGSLVEQPSWLEKTLREPQRPPRQRKGVLGNLGGGCIVFPLALAGLCLLVSGLRGVFPALSLTNPLIVIPIIGVAVVLAWVARSYLRRDRLGQAQFRWRRARYCARCNAVFVSGETVYTSPQQVANILWNRPSQLV